MNSNRSPIKPITMVLRGCAIRCPRCGGRKLFQHYFKLKERCPTCGYKIARDEGFWLGGYVMNVVIGEGLLALYLFYFATKVIAEPDMKIQSWLTIAVVLAIVPPILFFPLSRTTWMAFDLMIHPLEPHEVADAELHRPAT